MAAENRRGCVLGTRRCAPADLAQVVSCVAHHGRLSFGELSAHVGSRRDALSRMTDGHSESLTLRLALAITELQRDTRIVEEVARRAGGVFVPTETRALGDDDITRAFLRAVQEIGEDSAAIAQAIADGTVTSDEAAQVAREIDQTVAALLAVKARVQSKAQAPTLRRVTA